MRAVRHFIKPGWSILNWLSVLLLTGGCATAPRSTARLHPTAATQFNAIEKAVALTPEITLNEFTAGSIRERRDDWSDAARDRAAAQIERIGAGRVVLLIDPQDDPDLAEEIREVRALYRTIDANLAVFGSVLPNGPRAFEYSLGSIDRILVAADADALLIVHGLDDYFTSGRKALSVLSFVAAAVTGVYVMPSDGAAHVSAALVARDGTILWYDAISYGIRDLRTPEGVNQTLEALLRTLPASVRPVMPHPASET